MISGMDTIFKKFGQDVSLHLPDGWSSGTYTAFVQPLRYKSSKAFEGAQTQIGFTQERYYMYIGPKGHDLTVLPNDAYVLSDGRKFSVNKSERVFLHSSIYYIWAILTEMTEE